MQGLAINPVVFELNLSCEASVYSHKRSTRDRVLFCITRGMLAKTRDNKKAASNSAKCSIAPVCCRLSMIFRLLCRGIFIISPRLFRILF
ncbi:MAG: hypothetical protein RIQ79_578 [Verrucomicrobiota bacterium]